MSPGEIFSHPTPMVVASFYANKVNTFSNHEKQQTTQFVESDTIYDSGRFLETPTSLTRQPHYSGLPDLVELTYKYAELEILHIHTYDTVLKGLQKLLGSLLR